MWFVGFIKQLLNDAFFGIFSFLNGKVFKLIEYISWLTNILFELNFGMFGLYEFISKIGFIKGQIFSFVKKWYILYFILFFDFWL